jgi:hypothetical protein
MDNTIALSVIRQLKIDTITDTPNQILDWFNDLWNQMSIVEVDVFHKNGGELIYYINVDDQRKAIFLYDNQNERIWCHDELYWNYLNNVIGRENYINHIIIQYITEYLLENVVEDNWVYYQAMPYEPNSLIGVKIQELLKNIYA